MRYLLVTHIPFATLPNGNILLDRLWHEDLIGLAAQFESITVAAPCVDASDLLAWGVGTTEMPPDGPLRFHPLPRRITRFPLGHRLRLHRALRSAVRDADLVHTSNLFGNDVALYYAHDFAVRSGKKTLFVVAEDFYDMQAWEWVRTADSPFDRWRRQRAVDSLDKHVRRRVQTAFLTFLHTPAAVARYRLDAHNACAIRQPVHEAGDVISRSAMDAKLAILRAGDPLRIVTASRMQPLKGLDLLVRAVALLRDRDIAVHLTLYGGGPQQGYIESLVNRLDLSASVTFGGALSPGAELRTALNAQHVFAMPHLTSDFGRGFFDAMAAGLPVVAFRSVASQDTVRDGMDGVLVANMDVEALAAAIADLHTRRDHTAAMADNSRERALENTRSVWNGLRASWIRELFQ